jgi:hypothetical protein
MDKWTRKLVLDKLSYIMRVRHDPPPQQQNRSGINNSSMELSVDNLPIDEVRCNGKLSNGHCESAHDTGHLENKYLAESDQDDSFSRNCIVVLRKLVQTSGVEKKVAKQMNDIIQKMEEQQSGGTYLCSRMNL